MVFWEIYKRKIERKGEGKGKSKRKLCMCIYLQGPYFTSYVNKILCSYLSYTLKNPESLAL